MKHDAEIDVLFCRIQSAVWENNIPKINTLLKEARELKEKIDKEREKD